MNKKISTYLIIAIFSFSGVHCFSQSDQPVDIPYGDNPAVGKYANVNGIKMYYEEYGSGEPLLLIHGNGESLKSMENQIEFFKDKYRVIAADSRGHGKSTLGTDSLNYPQMAEDWAALIQYLNIQPTKIFGWSDGGIIGLLLGIHHPELTDKIVVYGANLRPDSTAVYSWAPVLVREQAKEVMALLKKGDTSQNWESIRQQLNLLVEQPDISLSELHTIQSPVLVMAGDKDIIKEEHTLQIYQNLKNAHLCILPGQTHFAPATHPDLVNPFIYSFLKKPFERPDSNWSK